MQKFTIKIDLSTFFNDQRRLIILIVDPQWADISALQHRVEQLLKIKPVLFLTTDNCFIPPDEPVEILKFFNIIKAFIPQESLRNDLQKMKAKSVEESMCSEIYPNLGGLKQKKRKFQAIENGCNSSTPNHPKRSKSTLGTQPKEKSCEITSTNEVICTEQQTNQTNNENINLSTENAPGVEHATKEVSNESSNKKSRKRAKNKNKSKISKTFLEEQDNYDISCNANILSSTQNPNNKYSETERSFKAHSAIKPQHIFFDPKSNSPNESKNMSVDGAKSSDEREFLSFRCGVTNTERRQFNDSIYNKNKKKSVEIIEHVIILPKKTPNQPLEISKTDSNEESCREENSRNSTGDSNKKENEINKSGTNISARKTFCVTKDESINVKEAELQSKTSVDISETCEKLKQKTNETMSSEDIETDCLNNASDSNQISDKNTGLDISNKSFKNLSAGTSNIEALNEHNRRTDSPFCKSSFTYRKQKRNAFNNKSEENLVIVEQNEKSDMLEVSNVHNHNSNIFQMDVTNMNSTEIRDDIDDKNKNITNLLNSDINTDMSITNRTEPLELENNSTIVSIEIECDESNRHEDLDMATEESKINEQLGNSNINRSTTMAELPRIPTENYNNSSIVSENNGNECELSITNNTDSHMDYTFGENTDDEPEIIELDETDSESIVMDKTTADEIAEVDVSKPLNELPNIGDIVKFKMLRLDESCTPIVTNYIKGLCEYVNKRTKNIKWRILDGHTQIHCIPSKFSTEFDDSTDTDFINIKFNDMIEPLLLKTS